MLCQKKGMVNKTPSLQALGKDSLFFPYCLQTSERDSAAGLSPGLSADLLPGQERAGNNVVTGA